MNQISTLLSLEISHSTCLLFKHVMVFQTCSESAWCQLAIASRVLPNAQIIKDSSDHPQRPGFPQLPTLLRMYPISLNIKKSRIPPIIKLFTIPNSLPISHNIQDYPINHITYAWWRHQMETFSALLAFVWGIHRSQVNSPLKGQWRGALMLLWCAPWIKGWVNNREADEKCQAFSRQSSTIAFL